MLLLYCRGFQEKVNSTLEELKKVRRDGLYSLQSEGELKQPISTITNLSEIFRKAGQFRMAEGVNYNVFSRLRSIANAADKKLDILKRLKVEIDFEALQ
jgi:hypothetical protein